MLTVPAVAGSAEDEALATLADAGFTLDEVERAYDQDVAEGLVVSTEPAAGEQVRHDTVVTVTVSRGKEPIEVPDVTGESEDDAVAALEDAGAFPQVDAHAYHDSVPEGHVISQSTTGEALRGDQVLLTISRGPELFEVPNVIGQQYSSAEEQLTGLGFEVRREDSLGGFFGTVRLQSVEAGEMVPAGTVIVLTVV